MSPEELNLGVDQLWQTEFDTFVETGNASNEFLAYLDQDSRCQEAVDQAFDAQASAFEEFSRAIIVATHPSSDVTRPQLQNVIGFFMGLIGKRGSEGRESSQDSEDPVAQVTTEPDRAELESTADSLKRTF